MRGWLSKSALALRCLTIIDIKSRFAPAIEVSFSIPGERVVSILNRLKEQRGLPRVIPVDNGSGFRSRALRKWAGDNDVMLDYLEPGQPTQNACINLSMRPFGGNVRMPIGLQALPTPEKRSNTGGMTITRKGRTGRLVDKHRLKRKINSLTKTG